MHGYQYRVKNGILEAVGFLELASTGDLAAKLALIYDVEISRLIQIHFHIYHSAILPAIPHSYWDRPTPDGSETSFFKIHLLAHFSDGHQYQLWVGSIMNNLI